MRHSGSRVLAMTACVAAFASPFAAAGTIVVDPGGMGDFTNLQPAIDAASAGDVIHVQGGVYHFVKIDKPLTIVGKPLAEIRPQFPGQTFDHCFGLQCGAVGLFGSGSGEVTLANLKIGGDWISDHVWPQPLASIYGGGFAELNIHRCTVFGPVPNGSDGTGPGAPTIDVTVPRIRIISSTVSGASNTTDVCCQKLPAAGPAGVYAPASSLLVLDSTIVGGAGSNKTFCFSPGCGGNPTPPTQCPCAGTGGKGGVGIVADKVFIADSIVEGGKGVEVEDEWIIPPVPWGKQPDGAPFEVSSLVNLPGGLHDSGPIELGGAWSLVVGAPAANNFLIIGAPTTIPVAVGGVAGPFFLDPSAPLIVLPIPNLASVSTTVPTLPAIVGVEVAFQVIEPATGWTRPVVEVIQP